ncbi:MAG: TIM barrel protein [Armatimonadetes bacterium]|nr:TIM barrel protein [Armatimonadota bacterium]
MPERTVSLDIGVNGAFITRRWEEPESWMRLTAELGYPYHEFCGDVLDPFFSGNRAYQLEAAAQVKGYAAEYGVRICDIYTGMATHRFHGLSHSHPVVRDRMKEWIVECMDIALAMGTDRVGGHWDAFSVEVLSDPERKAWAYENQQQIFRELAAVGREKGIQGIYQEQMYIPSEVPWTFTESDAFLIGANRGGKGCPVYLTVDVGHMAGQHYGLSGDEISYIKWLERLAAFSEIVHLQQTTPDASHHWPFTEEYNKRGHVQMEKVLEAIRYSHAHAHESPVAAYLKPVDRTILVAEIIPGSTKAEDKLLEELKITSQFLRKFVPEGGLRFSVGA